MRTLAALAALLGLLVLVALWKLGGGGGAPLPEAGPTEAVILMGLAPDGAEAGAAPGLEEVSAESIPLQPAAAAFQREQPSRGRAAVAQQAPAPARPQILVKVKVGKGDSLYRILQACYGKAGPKLVDEVARHNRLTDPTRIHPGDVLELPEVAGYPAPRPR